MQTNHQKFKYKIHRMKCSDLNTVMKKHKMQNKITIFKLKRLNTKLMNLYVFKGDIRIYLSTKDQGFLVPGITKAQI